MHAQHAKGLTLSKPKTIPNEASIVDFLEKQENPIRKRDCFSLIEIMKRLTGEEPQMWGSSIIGFGTYHFRYDSGREGDWFLVGFSPRKQALTLYIMSGFKKHDSLMAQLGKHKTGKSCLYIKTLDDVDLDILEDLIRHSVAYVKTKSVE